MNFCCLVCLPLAPKEGELHTTKATRKNGEPLVGIPPPTVDEEVANPEKMSMFKMEFEVVLKKKVQWEESE